MDDDRDSFDDLDARSSEHIAAAHAMLEASEQHSARARAILDETAEPRRRPDLRLIVGGRTD